MIAAIFRGPGLIATGAIAVCLALAAGVLVFAHAATEFQATRAQKSASERVVRLVDPIGREALEALMEALKKQDAVTAATPIEFTDLAAVANTRDAPEAAEAPLDPLGLVAVTLAGDSPSDIDERLQASLADLGLSVTIAGPGPPVRDAMAKAQQARFAALVLASIVAIALLLVARWIALLGISRSANPAQVLAFLGATRAQALARVSGPAIGAGFGAGLAGVLGVVGLALAIQAIAPELYGAFLPVSLPIDPISLTILASTPIVSAVFTRAGARAAASQAFAIEQPTP
ncbi:MAG: hypothetical protein ACOYKM_07210 [Caulobacterales bacterium]